MARAAKMGLVVGAIVAGIYAFAGDAPLRELPQHPIVEAPGSAGVLVVDLIDGSSERDLATIEALVHADLDWTSDLSMDEALAQGRVDDLENAVASLRDHPLIEAVEPMIEMHTLGYPDDPMFERQWNMRAIGAPAAWRTGAKGDGVIVAVVDTGVTQVTDLKGTQVLKGASFVPGTRSAADDQGHGTHVAGTIAQTTNNGIGVAGVAPNAIILPVKVLSKWGSGQSSWIASGIDYAADQGASVINLSLGGGYSRVIDIAIKKATDRGVVVVAAAGNSGRRGVGYPGALAETIGVSAIGPTGALAPYSSYGKGVDIAAPGGDKRSKNGGILQNTVDGRGKEVYAEYQGTSMATPHVAGAVAVLLSRGVPAKKVQSVLLSSAQSTGDWNEEVGHGTLDLAAAVSASVNHANGVRFFLGALLAFLLSHVAGTSVGFRMKSALVGGLTSGGLFFLSYLPLPDLLFFRLLESSLLQLPEVFFGGGWMHFPLWSSAAFPLVVAFTLGAFRRSRPIALGVSAGFGAALFHGAATGSLAPWWLPEILGHAWLTSNAAVSVLVAMGMAGTELLEEKK